MKKLGCFFIVILLFITGCTKNEYESTNGGDFGIGSDFWLKMGDGSIVSTSDIDFYDVSTHMIYLKKKLPYLENMGLYGGAMSVYVDDVEIYTCSFHSLLLSSLPEGAYISCVPSFYPEDIIRINFAQFINSNHEPQFTDHRSDKRIIAALKKNHQYHEGLHCEIQSVHVSNGKLGLNIELSNQDTYHYYYLDPNKMGIGLFHYFTNGLYLWNDAFTKNFTHQETVIHPEPWDSWKKEWLSLIRSGERKKISITYQHFDAIPSGKYKMYFEFPGLSHVSQKDRKLGNGRIWMGSIGTEKEIAIQ